MTSKPSSGELKQRSVVYKTLFLILIADLAWGLQSRLPVELWNWNNHVIDGMERSEHYLKEDGFWNRRFKFSQFLNPVWTHDFQNPEYLSSTICGNDLVALIVNPSDSSRPPQSECYRFNLRTGHHTRSAAPAGSCYVVSDGEQVWYLPHFDQFGRRNRYRQPFIVDGHAYAAIKRSEDDDPFELIEFVDGQWNAANRFALIPAKSAEFLCFRVGRETHVVVFDAENARILHRIGMPVGSKEQAVQFNAYYSGELRLNPHVGLRLQEIGWQTYERPYDVNDLLERQEWQDREIVCFRLNENVPSLLLNVQSHMGARANGQFWHQCSNERPASRRGFTPIRTSFNRQMPFGNFGFHFQGGTSIDGNTAVIFRDWLDGQLHVFRWDEGRFHQIGQTHSPLNRLICLDGVLLCLFAIAIPTPALLLMARVFQSFYCNLRCTTRNGEVVLASIVRRGIARMIDLSLISVPLLFAVVLHPDAAIWWIKLVESWNQLMRALDRGTSFMEIAHDASQVLWTLFAMPFVWWLFVPGILFLIGQIIWQGRSGISLGKWICGIRVVGTTLKPCGLSRSLLREIILVVETLFLLSGIPAVLVILSTKYSQRWGDLSADTIVIKSRSPITFRL